MKHCAIFVPSRFYGQPGPCKSQRAIKRIMVGDTAISACLVHRNMIASGGSTTLNCSRLGLTKPRRAVKI